MNQYDLVAHLYRQRAFSRATFGPGDRTLGVTDHIMKEVGEIKEAYQNMKSCSDMADNLPHLRFQKAAERMRWQNEIKKEWVGVVLLALDGLWRSCSDIDEAVDLIQEKQGRNENRNWPDWRTADPNAAIQHVKE